jgi:colanic acid biosynthesis glycosyl transferase WcaI
VSAIGAEKPDCILAISPPIQTGISAGLLGAAWRTPVCLHVKDLPLEAAQGVGLMGPGRLLRAGRALEWLAYRSADHVVLLDEIFGANLESHRVPQSKSSVIPNWVDVSEFECGERDTALRQICGASSTDHLILHTGNMGEKQQLVNVVEAADRLRHCTRFRFALVGDGIQRQLVQDAIVSRRLDNIRVVPLQPPASYGRLLASADLLVVNQAANVIDSVVPHKLLSYMAAGRPVVAAVHPESVAARLLRAAGCGRIVPPQDPDALARAFEQLAVDASHSVMLGLKGREYVKQHFDRRQLLDRWETLLCWLSTRRLSR